jgi:hypothetical protein
MRGFTEIRKEDVIISGANLAELISAVHDKGAAFRFKAGGASMRPAILNDDILTLSPLQGIPPFTGEVVAFSHPQSNRLILHRVVKKKGNSYFLRGDSQSWVDANIPAENILGAVIKVERRGRVLSWPDRFRHPLLTRLYFGSYLVYLYLRRFLRKTIKKTGVRFKWKTGKKG